MWVADLHSRMRATSGVKAFGAQRLAAGFFEGRQCAISTLCSQLNRIGGVFNSRLHEVWLPPRDSNPDKQIQNLLSYR